MGVIIMSELNFKDSIQIGIQKSNQADVNKAEIAEVFNEFSQAFLESSSGKISCIIKNKTRTKKPQNLNPILAASALMGYDYINYQALVLTNDNTDYEIAEIIKSNEGYPIQIKVGDDTSTYYDKKSLISGLNKLAARTEVGDYFKLLQEKSKD